MRVEVEDRHPCHAGAWVKGDVYTLEVKEFDPARGYVLQADIHGGNSTEGEFLFRKLRPGP